MKRVTNWERQLADYLDACAGKEFCWGEFDCCLFAADAVIAVTGIDLASEYRGKYDSELGAYKALKRYGKGDIKTTLNALLGQPKSVLNAKRGDVCLVNTPQGRLAAGICFSGFYSVSEKGLYLYDSSHVSAVWGIE